MNILSIIHGEEVRAGVFGEVVASRGHVLEEWSLAWETPPVRPLDDYGAVLVFGGAMHADQDDRHPWLREEHLVLQRLLSVGTPVLGVCLGAQLLAKAAGAPVHAASEPELGWAPVELTAQGSRDPVVGRLPARFEAFQWHYYTHGVPAGAAELARNGVCTQAFRLGEAAWGIQFHAEVTQAQVERWIQGSPEELTGLGLEPDSFRSEVASRIGAWNDLGRGLCAGFVEAAERVTRPGTAQRV
ncbi:MAG: type 1 glutamine amidotransferase [Gaiellaceae bacterium]